MIPVMHPMLAFYKQTWWLWLLFLGVFVALTVKVSALFVIMIPGLILYSIYFGVVRTSELAEREAAERQATASIPTEPEH
jgi:hypothetical protein